MREGTGEEKIRREDGDGKVRLGECQADHKIQRFHVRNRWIFFVYGLASFGFDHNFDHNANDFIWSIASANPLN